VDRIPAHGTSRLSKASSKTIVRFLPLPTSASTNDAPTATITAIPAATSSPSPSSSNRDHSHAGAIAGGVLGGIACLLLIILGIRLLLRRRNQVRNQQPQVPDGKNGVYQGLNELSADNNRPELSTHIPRVELGSGLPVGSEMEQPARDETSHEMPAGKS